MNKIYKQIDEHKTEISYKIDQFSKQNELYKSELLEYKWEMEGY